MRQCVLNFGLSWKMVCRKDGKLEISQTGIACFGFLLALSGCRSAPKLTQQQVEGQHLYQVRCAHCHEDNDLALRKAPPRLAGLFDRNNLPSGAPASDIEVSRVVLKGKGFMPSFAGRFTDEQMFALLAYLHTGMR